MYMSIAAKALHNYGKELHLSHMLNYICVINRGGQ
jgi:hypothetical protein